VRGANRGTSGYASVRQEYRATGGRGEILTEQNHKRRGEGRGRKEGACWHRLSEKTRYECREDWGGGSLGCELGGGGEESHGESAGGRKNRLGSSSKR